MVGCFEFKIRNKEKIQGVGLRFKIAQRIPDDLDGRADNVGDFVRVRLKGDERRIKDFYNELKKDIAGNPIEFTELTPIPDITIKTDRFYNRLQCEQMGKFVDVGVNMSKDMKEMSNEMKNLPKNLAVELAELKKKGLF